MSNSKDGKKMKKEKYIISVVMICMLLGIILSVKAIEETNYLSPDDSIIYTISLVIGDKLSWSFETYDEEFYVQVWLYPDISSERFILSENVVKNEGIWTCPINDSFWLFFYNMDDRLRAGYIDIYYERNAEPEPNNDFKFPSISGFNIIFLISLIGIISIVLYSIKKKL